MQQGREKTLISLTNVNHEFDDMFALSSVNKVSVFVKILMSSHRKAQALRLGHKLEMHLHKNHMLFLPGFPPMYRQSNLGVKGPYKKDSLHGPLLFDLDMSPVAWFYALA